MLRKSTDELVIKPRLSRPVRLAIALGAAMVVAGVSVAGYWGGRAMIYDNLESQAQEIDRLHDRLGETRNLRSNVEVRLQTTQQQLDETRRQLEEAKSSLTKVTRQLQIDQSAYTELRKQLEASNRQISELANELKFYRSIISPADGRSGVRIQEFELSPTDSENRYRYRLILIQALEHESKVKGLVRFEIHGTQDGAARTVRSPDETQGDISAEFKYFQNFTGTLELPAGFMPAEIKVIFEAEDDAVVQRMYPWPSENSGRNV